MRKSHFCLLSFLLLFSLFVSTLPAEDLVTLKNLSWEEQKNQTRIILETNQPLIYSVADSQTPSEVIVELSNLDLRNLPQELFINTGEVISLQTFPQASGQKSRIVVKMTAVRPYHMSTEGNKLYFDVSSNPAGDTLLAPITSQASPAMDKIVDPVMKEVADKVEEQKTAMQIASPAPVTTQPESISDSTTAANEKSAELMANATEVRDIRVDQNSVGVDVILVGNGSFQYDVFELSNPNRLVVDLKAVGIAPGVKNVVNSGSDLFSKVRLGQYQTSPKVARAVIDLRKKVPYSVSAEGTELRIQLGEKAETSQSEPQPSIEAEEMKEEPAPAMAEVILGKDEILISPSVKQDPVATAELKTPETPVANPVMNNEQFFQIKPDTSLFAQEGGSEGGSTASTSQGSAYGMGTFEEKTISGGQKQYTGEPFSFDFKDIDIKDLFRFIADISGLNVILDPGVKGSVTLKLTEVPWDQALDLICKNQGLGYQVEGNVIRIAPLRTIASEEQARQNAERQQILSAPLVTKVKPLSYAKAIEIDKVVRRLLTPKGTSILDARTNTLIITDIDKNIDSIINLIDTLDSRTTQVLIETRIVQTTKNFSQAFGIQWGFRGIADPAFGNNTSLQFPNNLLVDGAGLTPTSGITGNPLGGYAVNLPTNSAPNSALLLSAGNILDTFRLDVALMALEDSGNGRIISTPKIATQNNTKAEILQGTQIPVQTIANNTITTTFVNAALRMAVTPQITAEGTIILEVEVENNSPDFANVVFGTPPINTQKAQTTLLVEDGGTAVIGGIFQARDDYSQSRTPVLHRIPLLGWLFKNTNIERENRELLIFLTPRILR